MSEEVEVYDWMFQSESDETNLDILLDLQRGVEELGELNGSFRLKDVSEYHPTVFYDEFIWLVGSWRLPARYSPTRVTRYVNPNYVHRRMYGNVMVQCECGAYMGREVDRWSWDDEHHHTEGCKQKWRVEAREQLKENRKRWVETAADLYLYGEDVAARMGISDQAAYKYMERNGISWRDKRMKGKQRAIETWKTLHDDYGHTFREIAEAFGHSPKTVRVRVAEARSDE